MLKISLVKYQQTCDRAAGAGLAGGLPSIGQFWSSKETRRSSLIKIWREKAGRSLGGDHDVRSL